MQSDTNTSEVSQVVVLGSDGQPIGHTDLDEKASNLVDQVPAPAKVMRIGSMIKQLLEEVRTAPLDDASRQRLSEIHMRSIKELEDGLAPELVEELERLALPFDSGAIPSDAELRIAQAQLVGWLEGCALGSIEGCSEGCPLGSELGCVLGSDEGCAVG